VIRKNKSPKSEIKIILKIKKFKFAELKMVFAYLSFEHSQRILADELWRAALTFQHVDIGDAAADAAMPGRE